MNEAQLTRIAAYLDGELSSEDLERFERDMASDTSLAAQVAEWRDNDASIKDAFPLQAMANDPLAALILAKTEPAKAPPQVASIEVARERRDRRRFDWRWTGAIAASLLGVVGVSQWTRSADRGASGNDPILVAMASTPSGRTVTVTGGIRVSPILTVPTRDGYCREFVLEKQSVRNDAVACRDDGGWQMKLSTPSAAAPDGGGYATAGGGGSPAIDDLYRKLGAGDPLDPASENEAIARGWKARPNGDAEK
jgi:hypothetical protein